MRSSEEWAIRGYLTMDALESTEKPNPQLSRRLPLQGVLIRLMMEKPS